MLADFNFIGIYNLRLDSPDMESFHQKISVPNVLELTVIERKERKKYE